MKYIALPSSETRQLSFYLAMEEFVARHIKESDAFFMWQVKPSVIIGRNQVAENEVNLDYCRKHDIKVFRRKSGGGCVYADMDNLMLSFVTDGDHVAFTFNRFVQMILLVFHKLGIQATSTNHNDILIGDRKVCGTAFYQLPGRSIVHSTMLYDTNMEHMLYAITPTSEKLHKKGIESVRQRITLLKDHASYTLEDIKAVIKDTVCDGERMLTLAEITAIEQLEQTYLDEGFIRRTL